MIVTFGKYRHSSVKEIVDGVFPGRSNVLTILGQKKPSVESIKAIAFITFMSGLVVIPFWCAAIPSAEVKPTAGAIMSTVTVESQ